MVRHMQGREQMIRAIGTGSIDTMFVIDSRPSQRERRITSDERFLLLRAAKELLRQYERDVHDYLVYDGDQGEHYFQNRERDVELLIKLIDELAI
jgi:hypothetical protein